MLETIGAIAIVLTVIGLFAKLAFWALTKMGMQFNIDDDDSNTFNE